MGNSRRRSSREAYYADLDGAAARLALEHGQALGLDDRKEEVEREVRAPRADDLAALHREGRAREGVLDLRRRRGPRPWACRGPAICCRGRRRSRPCRRQRRCRGPRRCRSRPCRGSARSARPPARTSGSTRASCRRPSGAPSPAARPRPSASASRFEALSSMACEGVTVTRRRRRRGRAPSPGDTIITHRPRARRRAIPRPDPGGLRAPVCKEAPRPRAAVEVFDMGAGAARKNPSGGPRGLPGLPVNSLLDTPTGCRRGT